MMQGWTMSNTAIQSMRLEKNARSLVDGMDTLHNTNCHELFFIILSANAPASRAATFDVAAPDDATFMHFTLPLQKRNQFQYISPHRCSFLVIKTKKFVKLSQRSMRK